MNKETLATSCRRTADAASAAIDWIAANVTTVKQDAPLLTREFRRHHATAKRLAIAVERPMCVGVFGPSQSGKSYLISALARVGTQPLIAEFEGLDEGIDFVRKINPEGKNRESTGLVTRFSIRKQSTPPGFPVALRLLSQTDVVKILGNAYFSDCNLENEEPPRPEQILELIKGARLAASADAVDPLTADDVFDLQDYFEQRFKSQPLVKALQVSGYWQQAAELAPRLASAERAKLWAVLWGGIAEITNLAQFLYNALQELGFAATAYCGLDALVSSDNGVIDRRKNSIIDVDTLAGIGIDTAATLQITAGNRRPVTLPRSSVTALVAELSITMRDRPWPFFEYTDLLDFPGARSREIFELKSLGEPQKVEQLFLRGKVAYLFQRYCAEQELTSMLLCIAPANQEVKTLPGIVQEWIDATHGPDPTTRAANQTALFLVLTKLDDEFKGGVGASGELKARWSARLETSLLGFFGNGSNAWPINWHPGKAFNNTYWLRNPNFLAKHILDYGPRPQEIEIGIRPSEVETVAKAREYFISDPVVRTHFADPGRAWDEAFRLNDGGVSYLAEMLSPVCNPEIKLTQIRTRLHNQRVAMRERLAPYFVGGDLAEQRARRLARADETIKALKVCANAQRFGKLLTSLQLRDTELADVLYRVKTESELSGELAAESIGKDRESRYAEAIMSSWLERLRSLPTTPPMCRHFFLSDANAEHVVDELAAGARRTDLREVLAQRLREARSVRRRLGESTAKPALLAAECINSYVTWLGFDPDKAGERPRVGSGPSQRSIFAKPPVVEGLPSLGAQPKRFDLVFCEDWLGAFRKLVEDNAVDLGGQIVDVEQNRRLGDVLTLVEAN